MSFISTGQLIILQLVISTLLAGKPQKFTHLDSFLGPPLQFLLVGHHTCCKSAPVVPAPSNQHAANARHLAVGFEGERFRKRRRPQLPIRSCCDFCGLIVVSRKQRVLQRIELDFRAVYVEFGRGHFFLRLLELEMNNSNSFCIHL